MTLFADASFCHRTRAAGWGSWTIRDDWAKGRFQGGQIELKCEPCNSSDVAELAALTLALWSHNQRDELAGVHALMLQSDSVAALSLIGTHIPKARFVAHNRVTISRQAKNKHPSVPMILDTLKGIIGDRLLSLKHVKGHSDGKDGRSWVNNQCDVEAKRHMNALRKSLNGSCLV